MSSALLEQAFGKPVDELDIYKEVFQVDKTCTPAQLRKAYYKQALQYHPDKNKTDDAKIKFQAISWIYNILKDPEKRSDYDNEGILPHDDEGGDSDDEDEDAGGRKSWKSYFDLIFGKVTTNDIDNFAMKYKMSNEEEADVLKYWVEKKGNLMKMLEFVMLSELRDVSRWVEDYIEPALKSKSIPPFTETYKKSLKQVQKKLEKERQKEKEETEEQEDDPAEADGTVEVEVEVEVDADVNVSAAPGDVDDDETETEESENMNVEEDDDEEDDRKSKAKSSKSNITKNKKSPPKKASAGKTTAKKKKTMTTTKPAAQKKKTKKKQGGGASSQLDLIAAIRNKNRSNPFSAIGARYGVNMDEGDPLNDSQFEKLQSKLKKKSGSKKKK